MRNIEPIKKQTSSMAKKYKLYLSKLPTPKDKLSNKYNLLDDLNIADKALMKEIRSYTSELLIGRSKASVYNLRNR